MISDERFTNVEIASVAELRAWLCEHHSQEESVWLVRYLKSVSDKHVSRLELLDELLCFGWIDGVARKVDDQRTKQLISPRRHQAWAQSYKTRFDALAAAGRVAPSGYAAVERAKAAGTWNAYAVVDSLKVPEDLAARLSVNQAARSYFESCPRSYRRNLLRWLAAAKRADTRDARLSRIIAASADVTRIPQM